MEVWCVGMWGGGILFIMNGVLKLRWKNVLIFVFEGVCGVVVYVDGEKVVLV